MNKVYDDDLYYKMREIYKLVIEGIVDTGEMRDSDILFIRLYKDKFALVREVILES